MEAIIDHEEGSVNSVEDDLLVDTNNLESSAVGNDSDTSQSHHISDTKADKLFIVDPAASDSEVQFFSNSLSTDLASKTSFISSRFPDVSLANLLSAKPEWLVIGPSIRDGINNYFSDLIPLSALDGADAHSATLSNIGSLKETALFPSITVIATLPSGITLYGDDNNNSMSGSARNDTLYGNVLTAANPYSLLYSFDNPSPGAGDLFGLYMLTEANYILISAHSDDTGATNAGSAYLYDINTGNLLYTFNNPTPEDYDGFASTIAMNATHILIGAYSDDTGANNSGSAYLYDITTGNLIRTINNPSPANIDYFSSAIALTEDYAFIGGLTNQLYKYDLSTGALLHTFNNPTPNANDDFAAQIEISDNYIVIADPRDSFGANSAGSVYIYDFLTNNLLYTFNNPTPDLTDYFGQTIVQNDHYLVVGADRDDTGASNAGSAYIYDLTNGNLVATLNNPTPETNNNFGDTMAITDTHVLIGQPVDDAAGTNTGSVFVYELATGNLAYTLANPTPHTSDYFGYSFAAEGDYAIIGARYDLMGGIATTGAAYLYDLTSGDLLHTIPNPMPGAGDYFGNTLEMQGNILYVGAVNNMVGGVNAGSVYMYQFDFTDSDSMWGGAGDDTLYGLKGNDYLFGESGLDTLYGGEGGDTFVFELVSAFDAIDVIADFSTDEGDIIDISDVLSGYTAGFSDITEFVNFADNGADAVMQIDFDGNANGINYQDVAYILNSAGLDALTLLASGNLDTLV